MTGNISTRGAPVSDAAKLLIDQALELSALERAVVAEQLLLSLDRPDPKIDAVWASEAESRLAAYQNGRTEAVPRDGVRS
ncbi:MAG: addiction module protein [Pseudomonadales bacterium]|nr:addiction module protein [Pseudomonadales bacterium]